MKGLTYKFNNNPVQMSFQYRGHTNLTVTTVAEITAALPAKEVLLSLTVAAHVKVGSNVTATTSDMVLPAGVWPLLIVEGQTISVLKLTGSDSGLASIILVED